MATIYLFDIDGTLIHSGGAGRRSICQGIAAVTGRPVASVDPRFSFAGMTDRAILRRALQECGERAEMERIGAALDAYLDVLADEVKRASSYRVLEGVESILEALRQRGSMMGLGTGNAERGARIKLGRAGLNHYFTFGGFGCEAEDRADVIRRAIARGAAKFGEKPTSCRSVIIGDTPADIEAAKANGAASLIVSTGSWSHRELQKRDPTWLVDSLASKRARQVLMSF